MAPEAGGDPVCFDGLVFQDGEWLRLSVPRERLEADDYLVTITRFGLGDPTELGEALRREDPAVNLHQASDATGGKPL